MDTIEQRLTQLEQKIFELDGIKRAGDTSIIHGYSVFTDMVQGFDLLGAASNFLSTIATYSAYASSPGFRKTPPEAYKSEIVLLYDQFVQLKNELHGIPDERRLSLENLAKLSLSLDGLQKRIKGDYSETQAGKLGYKPAILSPFYHDTSRPDTCLTATIGNALLLVAAGRVLEMSPLPDNASPDFDEDGRYSFNIFIESKHIGEVMVKRDGSKIEYHISPAKKRGPGEIRVAERLSIYCNGRNYDTKVMSAANGNCRIELFNNESNFISSQGVNRFLRDMCQGTMAEIDYYMLK
ncbi:MAG: hypothetical protein HGA85_07710 [Nanoarchaeota archaeon]|nr:hypothetical protein [Nanoarchaeota archaeon]